MTAYVIPCPSQPSVAVDGLAERFPVRRVFCVGRNYEAHAREMGKDPEREKPFFFYKPSDALVDAGVPVVYPPDTSNLHHEAELVVAIGKGGVDVPEQEALGLVFGYAIGNDLTRRDRQFEARDKGRPWDWGKGFDNSAVCGPVHPVASVGHPARGAITLAVNGVLKQRGDLSELIWSVPEVISIISRSMRLMPGDLIFTGTPSGVGPLVPGDVCVVAIEGLGEISTEIRARG